MDIQNIAQITGIISLLLLFMTKFILVVSDDTGPSPLKTGVLWTSLYIFFLFVLRVCSYFDVGTMEQLRVISGFSSVIPITAVLVHLYLSRRVDKHVEETQEI
jgi:hypothetical protein